MQQIQELMDDGTCDFLTLIDWYKSSSVHSQPMHLIHTELLMITWITLMHDH
jgi:hypothetical protein